MAFALKDTRATVYTVNNFESGAHAHTVHLANFSQAWDQIISLFFMFHKIVQLMIPVLQNTTTILLIYSDEGLINKTPQHSGGISL